MERVQVAGVLYRLVRAQAQKSPRVIAVALIAPDTWGVRADFDDRRRDYRSCEDPLGRSYSSRHESRVSCDAGSVRSASSRGATYRTSSRRRSESTSVADKRAAPWPPAEGVFRLLKSRRLHGAPHFEPARDRL